MGGKSKYEESNQQILKTQQDQSQQRFELEKKYREQQDELLKPFIDQQRALIGDRSSLQAAIAPIITEIDDATRRAREDVYESTLPGGTRDVLMADISRSGRTEIARTRSNVWSQAFEKLANIGSGLGAFSLQQLGAGVRGLEGAATTARAGGEAESARKQATMGLLGSVVGAAGKVASGGSFAGAFGGGGSAAPASGSSGGGSWGGAF